MISVIDETRAEFASSSILHSTIVLHCKDLGVSLIWNLFAFKQIPFPPNHIWYPGEYPRCREKFREIVVNFARNALFSHVIMNDSRTAWIFTPPSVHGTMFL